MARSKASTAGSARATTACTRTSLAVTWASKAAGYEPGVYVFDVTFPQGVPFVVEEPRFDAGDMRGQPLAVAERHGPVPAAVQQQHREGYPGHVETPRG